MIMLREFKPEDLDLITDPIEPFCSMEGGGMVEYAGVGLTAYDENAVACAGVTYTNDGEGYIWMKMSCKCMDNAYAWARTVKEGFKIMVDSCGVKVYTYILDGFKIGERLAKSLGMKRTGDTETMNGKTYYKYVVA